jgi:hypothetical protein
VSAPIDLKKLREAAEKATPGPWVWWVDREYACLFSEPSFDKNKYFLSKPILDDGSAGAEYAPILEAGSSDAGYIAMANPDTILKLLDALEIYEKALVRQVEWQLHTFNNECRKCWAVKAIDTVSRLFEEEK